MYQKYLFLPKYSTQKYIRLYSVDTFVLVCYPTTNRSKSWIFGGGGCVAQIATLGFCLSKGSMDFDFLIDTGRNFEFFWNVVTVIEASLIIALNVSQIILKYSWCLSAWLCIQKKINAKLWSWKKLWYRSALIYNHTEAVKLLCIFNSFQFHAC